MNSHIHPILRDALNGSFRLPQPQIQRFGAKTEVRESANDEPKYIRTPELDKRVWWGDDFNGNAWHEVSTGRNRLFCTGYDANAGTWLHLDDPRRDELDQLRREGAL